MTRRPKRREGEMSKPTIQSLIRDIRDMPEAADAANIGLTLAERVEAVLVKCKRAVDYNSADAIFAAEILRALEGQS